VGASSTGSATTTATDDVHNCNDSPPTVTLTAPGSCSNSCTITATVTQGTHPLSDPQYAQFPGTVTITLDGQTIHSENVSGSPSTVSFTYTPTSSGSGNLTATVTDSVLYQGSQSTTLNFTSASPETGGITGFTAIISGSLINFNWSGGTPAYSVYRSDNNAPLCPSTASGNCSASKSLAPSGTSVTVKDSTGKTAATTVSGS
jgi:hypothetical protein